jgi:hypothetical protein
LDAFLQPQEPNDIKNLKYLMEKCAGKGATVVVFSSGGTMKNLTFSLDITLIILDFHLMKPKAKSKCNRLKKKIHLLSAKVKRGRMHGAENKCAIGQILRIDLMPKR